MLVKKSLGITLPPDQILPLTGIRFVAAAFVIWHHYLAWLSPFKGGVPSLFQFDTSKYGITLFFVLSGFVIHLTYAPLFQKEQSLKSIGSFAVARLARLYPLYLCFLLFCLIRSRSYLYRIVNDGDFRNFFFLHLLGIQSWLPFTLNGAIASNGPFHVSWSISTEFFFYLTYPFLFFFLQRIDSVTKAWRVLVAFSLISYCAFWLMTNKLDLIAEQFAKLAQSPINEGGNSPGYWLSYVSPFARLPEFIVGAIGASLFQRLRDQGRLDIKNKSATSLNIALHQHGGFFLALTIASAICFQNWSTFAQFLSKNFLIAPFVALLLVYVSLNQKSFFARALSLFPVFLLGEVSYSLYLLHPMLTRLIDIPLNAYEVSLQSVGFFVICFGTLLTILCALSIGTYLLLERPARKVIRRLAPGLV